MPPNFSVQVKTEGVEMVQRLNVEHEVQQCSTWWRSHGPYLGKTSSFQAKLEEVFKAQSEALDQLQQKLGKSHQASSPQPGCACCLRDSSCSYFLLEGAGG